VLGLYAPEDYSMRRRYRDLALVLWVAVPVSIYFMLGQSPVAMVTWTGISQAALLPIVSFATLYLAARHLPSETRAPAWVMTLLWGATIVITVFVLPSLYFEFLKLKLFQ
jgi:hypothetical protein